MTADYSTPPIAMAAPLAPPEPEYDLRGESSAVPPVPSDNNIDSATTTTLSEESLRALAEQGYSRGLANELMRNKRAFARCIWVVDNSGSMQTEDGHRLVATKRKNDVKLVSCTRWAEMQQTVDYHAQMAALLQSATSFRLLNDPGRVAGSQYFGIAERGEAYIDEDVAIAQSTMRRARPGGVTPLTRHLVEIRSQIVQVEPRLRHEGTKVAVILATDGVPTDELGSANDAVSRQFIEALRSLEGLPVWVVVRLCTDDEHVAKFWNDLDGQLELSLEVLDDFCSEAREVYRYNGWLNYALPLHRMRELGMYHRVFDVLDERKLSKDEVRDFFHFLLGDDEQMLAVPDPSADWQGFVAGIKPLLAKEQKQWNPITQRIEPWVNLKSLNKTYRGGSGGGSSLVSSSPAIVLAGILLSAAFALGSPVVAAAGVLLSVLLYLFSR